ncbi:MAG TPA: helix-hairpin-helix domain-containing protein [Actinocrinis sp.]|nr:helix-hairpin-helix domain-containing protein [Actinocrinis sp.]
MADAIAAPGPGPDPADRADPAAEAGAGPTGQADQTGQAGQRGRGPSKADLESLVQAGHAEAQAQARTQPGPAGQVPAPGESAGPGEGPGQVARAAAGPAKPDLALLGWLSEAGAPPAMAGRIIDFLGPEPAGQLRENPWQVLEVPGVGPTAADAVARAVLGTETEPEDPRRTRALAGWLLRRAAHRGSTAHGADVLAQELKQLHVADPTAAIADAIETGQLHAFAEPVALDEHSGRDEEEEFEELDDTDDDDPAAMLTSPRTVLCLERWTFVEQAAAEVVQRLFATPEPVEAGPEAGPLAAAVAENGLTLATNADTAALLPVLAAFPQAVIATPSAAGLRTLHEAGVAAVDVRTLAAQDYAGLAGAQVLVVADAQLLSLEGGTALLEATAEGTHVLLAGDPVSLRSAEPGALFRDLLEIDEPEFGGLLPRQAIKRRPTGPLTSLIEAVRYGGLPPRELLQGEDGQSKEVVIVTVKDPQEAVGRTLQLVTDSIPRTFTFEADQIQVVAPRADGPVGTHTLNAALKSRLNPGPGRCAGFDPGDRVVISGPVPELGLFGGETGLVTGADAQELTVRLDPPHEIRRPAVVPAGLAGTEAGAGSPAEAGAGSGGEAAGETELDESGPAAGPAAGGAPGAGAVAPEPEVLWRIDAAGAAERLRHAWALTAREAQGGRWPAVVAVFDGAAAAELTRALVLGMVGLATEHLSVIHGAGAMLAKSVESIPDQPRRTRLQFALRD